jgi:hypothetical protein
LKEAQVVIEKWRVEYNTKRPHSPLGSKSIFTAHGCDIKTLTSLGLTNQAGHLLTRQARSSIISVGLAGHSGTNQTLLLVRSRLEMSSYAATNNVSVDPKSQSTTTFL